jgi:hypothetical protein
MKILQKIKEGFIIRGDFGYWAVFSNGFFYDVFTEEFLGNKLPENYILRVVIENTHPVLQEN